MNSSDRATLRRDLRIRRRSLTESELRFAAKQLYHRIVNQTFFIKAKRIAFYLASDAEIDPLAILFKALAMGKQCYLPLISTHQPGKVVFTLYKEGDPLQANQWGILEPVNHPHDLVAPQTLNLVFVPLVGFDSQCNRMGMGMGFYDRTFSFRHGNSITRPVLVGLAHECQKVDSLPVQPWDVPLDAVATDNDLYRPGKP